MPKLHRALDNKGHPLGFLASDHYPLPFTTNHGVCLNPDKINIHTPFSNYGVRQYPENSLMALLLNKKSDYQSGDAFNQLSARHMFFRIYNSYCIVFV